MYLSHLSLSSTSFSASFEVHSWSHPFWGGAPCCLRVCIYRHVLCVYVRHVFADRSWGPTVKDGVESDRHAG